MSSLTPAPTGPLSVAEFFDLLFSAPRVASERLGSNVALLPLEPWVLSSRGGLRDATLTGRAQLVRTTLGRQAPAVEAWPYGIAARPVSQIGRSRQATLRIDQPTISRIHAELLVSGSQVSIRDCGSYNGTLVNGRILGPGETVQLNDGDVVTFGESQLLFGSLEHFATLIRPAK